MKENTGKGRFKVYVQLRLFLIKWHDILRRKKSRNVNEMLNGLITKLSANT